MPAAPAPASPLAPFNQLGVIGCGLMGGSFALALKRAGLVKRVVGFSKSPSTTELACRLGVIDAAAESALLAVAGSDIVLIAVPVAATEATFKAIRHGMTEGVLFMDVGSTKRDVVDTARRVLKEPGRLASFVPAHPITGKETAGVQHADAALYAGRQLILTPMAQTDPALLAKARAVWTAIGAQVSTMSPETHDATFAAVSHLPHLLAFGYLLSLASHPAGSDFLAHGGPGFRDFTRIAASDPTVWRDILLANREEVLRMLHRFNHAIQGLELAMNTHNAPALEDMIRLASEARSGWQIGGRGNSGSHT